MANRQEYNTRQFNRDSYNYSSSASESLTPSEDIQLQTEKILNESMALFDALPPQTQYKTAADIVRLGDWVIIDRPNSESHWEA